jgi:flavin reductase (DIM6/NTAB) family NADH-FMN oxidoreductase RutF
MDGLNARLNHALGRFAGGLAVLATATADGGAQGTALSVLDRISARPALLLTRLPERFAQLAGLEEGRLFTVNVLTGAQRGLATAFTRPRGGEHFLEGRWLLADDGCPYLPEAAAWIECRVERQLALGDGVLLVGKALRCATPAVDGGPLIRYDGALRWARPHHLPSIQDGEQADVMWSVPGPIPRPLDDDELFPDA